MFTNLRNSGSRTGPPGVPGKCPHGRRPASPQPGGAAVSQSPALPLAEEGSSRKTSARRPVSRGWWRGSAYRKQVPQVSPPRAGGGVQDHAGPERLLRGSDYSDTHVNAGSVRGQQALSISGLWNPTHRHLGSRFIRAPPVSTRHRRLWWLLLPRSPLLMKLTPDPFLSLQAGTYLGKFHTQISGKTRAANCHGVNTLSRPSSSYQHGITRYRTEKRSTSLCSL